MPPSNGMPPQMPGVNGFPSPGRGGAMMMNQGSQQGHQPPPPMYGMNPGMNPGMSPGPQYVNTAQGYNQQPPPNSKCSEPTKFCNQLTIRSGNERV